MINDVLENIKFALQRYHNKDLYNNSLFLLDVLGYVSNKKLKLDSNPIFFLNYFDPFNNLNKERANFSHWLKIEFLFQYTSEDIMPLTSNFVHSQLDYKIINSFIFLAVELKNDEYSKTDIKVISYFINKTFRSPCFIIFRYGQYITLSICDRRVNKRDYSKDVLEDIHLVKDINIYRPGETQLNSIYSLVLPVILEEHPVTNFIELHSVWVSLFDESKEPFEFDSVEFYEIGNYYFDRLRFDDAIYYYTLAIDIDESFIDAYLNRAKAYLDIEELNNAKDDLEIVLSKDPLNEEALNLWGMFSFTDFGNYYEA